LEACQTAAGSGPDWPGSLQPWAGSLTATDVRGFEQSAD
jgi:hypothetical protein